MSLSAQEIEKIARLARLELTDPSATGQDLSRILALVDQLRQVDTQQIEPLYSPLEMVPNGAIGPLRKDQSMPYAIRDEVLAKAPAAAEGLFLVPKVLD